MAMSAVFNDVTFRVGDTVKVHYRLIEREKVAGKAKREVKEEVRERIQIFEGVVIGIKGEGDNRTFMVRRIGVGNIGIERIFPLISPWIKKISVSKEGHARRAKLYFLREKHGREAEKSIEKKENSRIQVKKKTKAVKKPSVNKKIPEQNAPQQP